MGLGGVTGGTDLAALRELSGGSKSQRYTLYCSQPEQRVEGAVGGAERTEIALSHEGR